MHWIVRYGNFIYSGKHQKSGRIVKFQLTPCFIEICPDITLRAGVLETTL